MLQRTEQGPACGRPGKATLRRRKQWPWALGAGDVVLLSSELGALSRLTSLSWSSDARTGERGFNGFSGLCSSGFKGEEKQFEQTLDVLCGGELPVIGHDQEGLPDYPSREFLLIKAGSLRLCHMDSPMEMPSAVAL